MCTGSVEFHEDYDVLGTECRSASCTGLAVLPPPSMSFSLPRPSQLARPLLGECVWLTGGLGPLWLPGLGVLALGYQEGSSVHEPMPLCSGMALHSRWAGLTLAGLASLHCPDASWAERSALVVRYRPAAVPDVSCGVSRMHWFLSRVDLIGASSWFGEGWVRCLRIASVARGQSPVPSFSVLAAVFQGLAVLHILLVALHVCWGILEAEHVDLGLYRTRRYDFSLLGKALLDLWRHLVPGPHRIPVFCLDEHHFNAHCRSLLCLSVLWLIGALISGCADAPFWDPGPVITFALWPPLWCLVALGSVLCQQMFPRRSTFGFLAVGPGHLVNTSCISCIGSVGALSRGPLRWGGPFLK